MTVFKRFEYLVDQELEGKELNQSDYQLLHGNPKKWRDCLVAKLQDLDVQFTSRRADSLSSDIPGARIAYENWRKKAVLYKRVLVDRLQEMNRTVSSNNVIQHDDKFFEILSELKIIRTLLEARNNPKTDTPTP